MKNLEKRKGIYFDMQANSNLSIHNKEKIMRNIKQNTFILFLLGLMFSCNSDSSQSESNSPSFFEDILEANSGEKKEITNLLEKSYNECMQVDFSDRSNLPFYNMNLENRMVYTFFPLFITGNEKFKDGLTLNPSNISLIEMSDDEKEAKIKYDLTENGKLWIQIG